MGLWAKNQEIDLTGATIRIEKHMSTEPPRKVGKLVLALSLPASIPENRRDALQRVVDACPVGLSIASSIEITKSYKYV